MLWGCTSDFVIRLESHQNAASRLHSLLLVGIAPGHLGGTAGAKCHLPHPKCHLGGTWCHLVPPSAILVQRTLSTTFPFSGRQFHLSFEIVRSCLESSMAPGSRLESSVVPAAAPGSRVLSQVLKLSRQLQAIAVVFFSLCSRVIRC